MPRNSQQTTDMPPTKNVAVSSSAATSTPAPATTSAADSTVKRVPRRPKADAEATPAAATSTTSVAAVSASEPSTATPTKASRSSKAVAPVAVAPASASSVSEPVPAAAPESSSADEAVSEVDALKQRLTAALEAVRAEKARLQEVGKNLVTLVESLVRDTNTVLRKSLRRKRRTGTSNANSGFLKPKLVTQELCAFLERPAGTQMSRTEVTRSICDYIKRNDLQDKKNRRIIVPDQRLSGLLKLDKGQTLTYFDLQSKMNHLFAEEPTA
jgi:chromatin remodeling complex protein RSC6